MVDDFFLWFPCHQSDILREVAQSSKVPSFFGAVSVAFCRVDHLVFWWCWMTWFKKLSVRVVNTDAKMTSCLSILINLFSCFELMLLICWGCFIETWNGSMRDATCEDHKSLESILVWWFKRWFVFDFYPYWVAVSSVVYYRPYLVKWSYFTSIFFRLGWFNNQLAYLGRG